MPPADYSGQGSGEPALKGFVISPDDQADLAVLPRAIYVGGSGNVTVKMLDNTTLVFIGVLGGSFLPIRPSRVMATGTTATAMVGVY
jgi:hypothetical protein